MPFFKMSLERFEQLLKVRNSDLTPSVEIELSTSSLELRQQLVRLKTAIDATTRFISEFYCVFADGRSFGSIDDPEIKKMYYSHIALPMKEKYEAQTSIRKAIKTEPFGPYADFFRTPDAPHNNQGKAFPQSESAALAPVPEKFFHDQVGMSINASKGTISSFTPSFRR